MSPGRWLSACLGEFVSLIELLDRETDSSARILFEDQLRLFEPTDPESADASILLPLLMGKERRQFIGGDYQMAFIKHHESASFGDFSLGGDRHRPLVAGPVRGVRSPI